MLCRLEEGAPLLIALVLSYVEIIARSVSSLIDNLWFYVAKVTGDL